MLYLGHRLTAGLCPATMERGVGPLAEQVACTRGVCGRARIYAGVNGRATTTPGRSQDGARVLRTSLKW